MSMSIGTRRVKINDKDIVTMYVFLRRMTGKKPHFYFVGSTRLFGFGIALDWNEGEKPAYSTVDTYRLDNGRMVQVQ